MRRTRTRETSRAEALRLPGARLFEGRGRWVVVAHHFTGDTLFLRVVGERQRLVARLRVGRAPSLLDAYRHHGEHATAAHDLWDLTAGAPSAGVFGSLARTCIRSAFRGPGAAPPRPGPPLGYAAALAHVRAIARAALARCDPGARALAMRFSGGTRWWVYRHVVADPTGRIAQLVESCPGLLVLTHAFACHPFDEARNRAAAREILGAVIAGASLRKTVDDAVERWSRLRTVRRMPLRSWRARTGRRPPGSLALKRIQVRRAGPAVREADLAAPPPPDFAPEDIPRSALDNALWFEAMSEAERELCQERDPVLRARMSRFVSRHALPLFRGAWRRAQRPWVFPRSAGEVVRRLLAHAHATGRGPARSWNPRRLVERAARWSEVTTFPPGPASPASTLALEPIATAAALEREGEEMSHCVASYTERAAAGEVFFYRGGGACRARRLTVAIVRRRGRWELLEARGADNRAPTRGERRRLRSWLARLDPEGR